MKKRLFLALAVLFSQSTLAEIDQQVLARAKQGDSLAQLDVAIYFCDNGKYEAGMAWLERANDALTVAIYYQEGLCDNKKDYAKALKWYKRLLNLEKDPSSRDITEYRIAELYFLGGYGLQQKVSWAIDTFKRLAKLSDNKFSRGLGRYRLAQIYYEGKYLPQDDDLAYEWASKSWEDEIMPGGIIKAYLDYEKKGNKKQAMELMKELCDRTTHQKVCGWYLDMKTNRPLREGSFDFFLQ